MSGIKGRSGGVRKNSGGARKNAGRPKTHDDNEGFSMLAVPEPADSPLQFLLGVMNDIRLDPKMRVRAAIAAARYSHNIVGESGRKEEKIRAAEKASVGRFQSGAPPLNIISIKRKPNEKA